MRTVAAGRRTLPWGHSSPRSTPGGDALRTSQEARGQASRRNRFGDLVALTKPRITLMVVISSAGGYAVGAGSSLQVGHMLAAILGIGLVAGGTSALNQVLERDVDALMHRTRRRPLPAGRVTPRAATAFSLAVSIIGVAYLAVAVNPLTATLGAVAVLSYALVYTPLKRVSSLSTLVGAVPGALPIMGGWTAARGDLGPGAWALFGILFFWQLPHFLSLAWIYREDYRRGGLKMMGVTDAHGIQTRRQSVLYALALLPTSLLPAILGLSGGVYALVALLLTLAYVGRAVRFAVRADMATARRLFRGSLLYLPLLLIVLAADRGPAMSEAHIGLHPIELETPLSGGE